MAESSNSVAANRIPLFSGTHFPYWKIRMRCYIQSLGYDVWKVTENPIPTRANPEAPLTFEEIKVREIDAKALNALFTGLSVEVFDRVSNLTSANDVWKTLAEIHEGTTVVKEEKLVVVKEKFDQFKMLPNECVNEMFSRLNPIVNELKGLDAPVSDIDVCRKMIRILPKEYRDIVTYLSNSGDLKKLTPTELLGRLSAHEMLIHNGEDPSSKKKDKSSEPKVIALKAKGSAPDDEDESSDADSESDLNELALLMRRAGKIMGRNNFGDPRKRTFNSSRPKTFANIRCYECGERGHIASMCDKKLKDKDKLKVKSSDDEVPKHKSKDKAHGRDKKKSHFKPRFRKTDKKGKRQAFVGEWVTDEESSSDSSSSSSDENEGSRSKGLAGLAIAESTPPPPAFPPMCLMGTHDKAKVQNPSSPIEEYLELINDMGAQLQKQDSKNKLLKKTLESLTLQHEQVVDKLESLQIDHSALLESHQEYASKCEELEMEKTALLESHDDLILVCDDIRDKYESLLAKRRCVSNCHVSLSCDDLVDEDNDVVVSKSASKVDASTCCDDLLDITMIASSSAGTSSSNTLNHACDIDTCKSALAVRELIIENTELKSNLAKFEKGLGRSLESSIALEKMIKDQKSPSNKGGLGFTPPKKSKKKKSGPKSNGKGKAPPNAISGHRNKNWYNNHALGKRHNSTNYHVKRDKGWNTHYITHIPKFRQVFVKKSKHVVGDYWLRRNHLGKVYAQFVGHPDDYKYQRAIWVPKSFLVNSFGLNVVEANPWGPKTTWVPKSSK